MPFATPTFNFWEKRPTLVSKTSAYTIASTDRWVRADCTSGNLALTLPPSSGVPSMAVLVQRVDASSNDITIAVAGTSAESFKDDEVFGGFTTLNLRRKGSAFYLVSTADGTGWHIMDVLGRYSMPVLWHNANLASGVTSLAPLYSTKLGAGQFTGANTTVIARGRVLGLAIDVGHGSDPDPGDWTYTCQIVDGDGAVQRSDTMTVDMDKIGVLNHNPQTKLFSTPLTIDPATEVLQGAFTGPSTDAVLFSVLHHILIDP